MAEPAEPVIYRYLGPGFLPGVPARDLRALDVDPIDPELLAEAVALGLYVKE